ncbi:hypothetical protein ABE438_18885 [Bosea sp. TWI1241]|jgi:hypothetical protein|uniref:hypothetical protein n=1 Tax=Bosea sp. TWI1241 TaxID=3148904 RepID=UPI0032098247
MTKQHHASPQTRQPQTTVPPTVVKACPNWKPEPCGLSRDELRAIVARIMG